MNTYQSKWNEIRNEVLRTWGSLTNEDLDRAKDNSQKLVETVQQKVGAGQSDVKTKIDDILKKFDVSTETRQ